MVAHKKPSRRGRGLKPGDKVRVIATGQVGGVVSSGPGKMSDSFVTIEGILVEVRFEGYEEDNAHFLHDDDDYVHNWEIYLLEELEIVQRRPKGGF